MEVLTWSQVALGILLAIGHFVSRIWRAKVAWSAWQFGVLKWSQIALGVLLGALFAEFWKPYLWLVVGVFVVATAWSGFMYFQAMGRRPE